MVTIPLPRAPLLLLASAAGGRCCSRCRSPLGPWLRCQITGTAPPPPACNSRPTCARRRPARARPSLRSRPGRRSQRRARGLRSSAPCGRHGRTVPAAARPGPPASASSPRLWPGPPAGLCLGSAFRGAGPVRSSAPKASWPFAHASFAPPAAWTREPQWPAHAALELRNVSSQ